MKQQIRVILAYIRRDHILIPNIIVGLFLFVLPYYLFGNEMRLEGDDSRLYYIYPGLWMDNVSNSSWLSFSSLPKFDTQYFFLPLLLLLRLIYAIFHIPQFVILNLAYTLVLLLGYLAFQKLLNELFRPSNIDIRLEAFLGSLIYIFSPILLLTPLRAFLGGVWLIPLVPFALYCFLMYFRQKSNFYLVIGPASLLIGAIAINAVPWILGIFLPVALSGMLLMLVNFSAKVNLKIIKKGTIFLLVTLLLQSFWLVPFISTILSPDNSLGSRIFDPEFTDTYAKEVEAISRGNSIIFPLLNLFHYQIQKNFNWSSLNSYDTWHLPFLWVNTIYVFVIFSGLFLHTKKRKHTSQGIIYTYLLISFAISLFLFTADIGFLKRIFLSLNIIPGFVMFRNFYDKFALGYVLIYSGFLTVSLLYIKQHTKRTAYNVLVGIIVLSITINAKPLMSGEIFNAPYSHTNIQKTLTIPNEYIDFMGKVGSLLPASSNILSLPFGTSAYTAIYDPDTGHLYSGKSPVKLFSGTNDFSGDISFPTGIAKIFSTILLSHDYVRLNNFFDIFHVNYAVETRNIPSSFLLTTNFSTQSLAAQNSDFKTNTFHNTILESEEGNYALYQRNTSSNEVFTIASSIATYESGKFTDKTWLALLPLMDSKQVLVDANNNFSTKSIQELTEKSYRNRKDQTSTLFTSSKPYYVISNDHTTHSLEIIEGKTFSLPIARQQMTTLRYHEDEMVFVHNEVRPILEFESTGISSNDVAQIFTTQDETNYISSSGWVSGDCNARDGSHKVNHDYSTSTITLSAETLHNACSHKSLQHLMGGDKYVLELELTSNLEVLPLYLEFNSGDKIIRDLTITKNGSEKKQAIFVYFEAPRLATEGTLYLYSGKHEVHAETTYSRVLIKHMTGRNILDSVVKQTLDEVAKVDSERSQWSPDPYEIEYEEKKDFDSWNTGDCGAINTDKATAFSFATGTNEVILSSTGNHNACLYKKFPISSAYAYNITFEASTRTEPKSLVFLDFGTSSPFQKIYLAPNDDYAGAEINVIPNPKDTFLRIYFYSGSSNSTQSLTKFRNFKLQKRLIANDTSYIINGRDTIASSEQTVKSNISKIRKIANHAYVINVNYRSPFLLHFLETYHDGWHIYRYSPAMPWQIYFEKKPESFQHVEVNNYSNGWWIDDAKCTNTRPSCEISYLVLFTPQRWFYLGLLISGTTLASCLGYLGYDWRRRRRERKKVSRLR